MGGVLGGDNFPGIEEALGGILGGVNVSGIEREGSNPGFSATSSTGKNSGERRSKQIIWKTDLWILIGTRGTLIRQRGITLLSLGGWTTSAQR